MALAPRPDRGEYRGLRRGCVRADIAPGPNFWRRTFAVDVLVCPSCQGRMRLLAVVKNPVSIARYLAATSELTEVPGRSLPRAPPYWKSQVLRRQALGDEGHGRGDEAA